MERIKKWFLHNPFLKLISLVLAFILWLIVVNTSNPRVTSSISVPFDVLNEKAILSANQVYVTNVQDVTISYTVRTKYKNEITQDAFSAYINLEDYSITGAVPVYIEIDAGVSELISDVSVEPGVVHVTTEGIQQKEFSIGSELVGEPAEGYKAGELSINPQTLQVKGPVSLIGQITSCGIRVDIEGATSDMEGTSTVLFYDANGNELDGIEDSLSFAGDVNYSLPVYRIKSLTVNAFVGGAPASGYAVDSVETSPTFISVYGTEEVLDNYSYIVIPGNELNVSGASESKTFNIDVENHIPEGLKLANQTSEITVYVKIKSIYDSPEDDVSDGRKPQETKEEPAEETSSEEESLSESVTDTTETVTEPSESTEDSAETQESSSPQESSEQESESPEETEETDPQEGEESLPQQD